MFSIDVGANIGFHTLQMARLVGTSGKVIAFEPASDNYTLLLSNLRLNRFTNVEAKKIAASDRYGALKLYKTLNSGGDSLIVQSLFWENVKADRLDNLIKEAPNLVKIDIEGNELRALKGMVQILGNTSDLKLIIEFNEPLIRRSGFKPLDLLNFLHSFGFDAYAILPNGELKEYAYGKVQIFENLFFVRE